MAIDKLVDSAQLESDLTDVADAIRAKTGGTADLQFPADFVSEIGSISGGGGYTIDDWCDSASTPSGAVTIDNATSIGDYAFAGRTGITSISSNSVTTIYKRAFEHCDNLLDVSFPNLVYIRENPNRTNYSYSLTSFNGCTSLRSVYMPKLEYIYGGGCFSGKTDDTTGGCGTSSLVFVFPSIKDIPYTCFSACYAQMYDIGPNCESIYSDAFFGRYAAFQRNRTVILRRTAGVVVAKTSDAIREITDVYCPQSLIASYQAATNWSTRYNGGYITFHAIEGSQYENYYADGTPIPTT